MPINQLCQSYIERLDPEAQNLLKVSDGADLEKWVRVANGYLSSMALKLRRINQILEKTWWMSHNQAHFEHKSPENVQKIIDVYLDYVTLYERLADSPIGRLMSSEVLLDRLGPLQILDETEFSFKKARFGYAFKLPEQVDGKLILRSAQSLKKLMEKSIRNLKGLDSMSRRGWAPNSTIPHIEDYYVGSIENLLINHPGALGAAAMSTLHAGPILCKAMQAVALREDRQQKIHIGMTLLAMVPMGMAIRAAYVLRGVAFGSRAKAALGTLGTRSSVLLGVPAGIAGMADYDSAKERARNLTRLAYSLGGLRVLGKDVFDSWKNVEDKFWHAVLDGALLAVDLGALNRAVGTAIKSGDDIGAIDGRIADKITVPPCN